MEQIHFDFHLLWMEESASSNWQLFYDKLRSFWLLESWQSIFCWWRLGHLHLLLSSNWRISIYFYCLLYSSQNLSKKFSTPCFQICSNTSQILRYISTMTPWDMSYRPLLHIPPYQAILVQISTICFFFSFAFVQSNLIQTTLSSSSTKDYLPRKMSQIQSLFSMISGDFLLLDPVNR